jgi:flagellin
VSFLCFSFRSKDKDVLIKTISRRKLMGLRINTNIQALNAHKNLTKTDGMLSESLGRLSSGLRINKAADDASGLAIADTLRAQHTGIGQAVSNASDGVNIIQIADGALEESINIVNTIRTKAIQAASDAQSDASRKAIQADVDKLLEELNMIAESTAYNGINLLDGTFVDKQFHIGAYKDEIAKVNIGNASGEVVGAMAYAKTDRLNEAAVSDPFMQGGTVTGESLANGDITINGTLIGATSDQVIAYSTQNVTVTASTAMAKAQAINDKLNETGVQAKATTETVVALAAGTVFSGTINGVAIASADAVDTSSELVSFINNNGSLQKMGIKAESVTASQTRIIASDGRKLDIAALARMDVGGVTISGATHSNLGKLTLSNARAMTSSNEAIKEGTINSGDLLINGVDVAAGGSLNIKDNDNDRTLVNAINGNEDLQKLGIRAELYNPGGGTRVRLISNSQPIEISGVDPKTVSGLLPGETQGTQTTGIIVESNATDTNTDDDFLRRIGFDGAKYGTQESTGVNNVGGNDEAVISRAYLETDNVIGQSLADGDIYINDVKIEASADQVIAYSTQNVTVTASTAMAKAQAINDKLNETGVQAKATTESVVALAGGTNFAGTINGVTISAGNAVDNSSELVSFINNNGSLQKMGITAESVTASQTRIIASDGRELEIAATARMDIGGVNISGATHSNLGKLTLSNARAMVSGNNEVTAGNINAGELVINGVDIAAGGALTVAANDDDRTLVNAINNNNELQKMGIRAELYNPDGDGSRIRLISERDEITISGTDPNKVANLTSGTTEGIRTTELKITGSPVDSDAASDNYLVKIGLSGSRYGAAEEDGVNNSGGNDIIYFGKDRLQFDSGDVSINGVIVGQPSDDGISHAMGDRSAAAWAEAVNSISDQTGVEADIVKAQQTGAGMVTEGVLQQGDLKINGIDIVRDNTGGSGMSIKDGDAGDTLINAINEYKDETGVIASKDADGKLVLSARDGRNIHVESTANGNKLVKFAADFGNKGVAQDSVVFGNIRLVSNEQFTVDGAGSSASTRELSLLKMGLSGGGATTEATSDMKGDGTILAGLNYQTAIANVDVTTQEGANMAIRTADYALERLDEIRAGLGSTQNQLTSTIANLSVTKINVQATESSIRDVDFAAESTQFSKMQVLMQAGTYAQSQANATAQNVMRLLQ